MEERETKGSHDGTGAGDHDEAYEFGNPMLNTREHARLIMLRGLVMDARRGEYGGAADGDVASAGRAGQLKEDAVWMHSI